MKWLLPLKDLTFNQSPDQGDYYLELKEFSRFGTISIDEGITLASDARKKGFSVFLQLDLLSTQVKYDELKKKLSLDFLKLFDAVRIQDPGLVYYFKNNFSEIPLHVILENGNHNICGILTWEELLGAQLNRFVLSSELSKVKLKEYRSKLKTPFEILGAGRILLFYTPRSLLSAQFIDHDDSESKRMFNSDIEISGSSEESPHSGFPILENSHGTFMFLPKDMFLLDQLAAIKEIGVEFLRVNFSHLEVKNELEKKVISENLDDFKEIYPLRTIKGFFNVNKSDVLFPKLKNQLSQRKDDSFCGEVLEVKKKKYIALNVQAKNGIKLGDAITYYTPDGKIKVTTIRSLKNSRNEDVNVLQKGELAFLPHVGGISIKSMAYHGENPLS